MACLLYGNCRYTISGENGVPERKHWEKMKFVYNFDYLSVVILSLDIAIYDETLIKFS